MLAFRHWLTEGISQISYLIGDDSTHTAAVIDPRPDVDIYLDASRELGVAITHILETHIHADYMSGSRELASRLGNAEICASGEGAEGGEEYGFAVHRLRDGDVLAFGSACCAPASRPGIRPSICPTKPARSRSRSVPGVFSAAMRSSSARPAGRTCLVIGRRRR